MSLAGDLFAQEVRAAAAAAFFLSLLLEFCEIPYYFVLRRVVSRKVVQNSTKVIHTAFIRF